MLKSLGTRNLVVLYAGASIAYKIGVNGEQLPSIAL